MKSITRECDPLVLGAAPFEEAELTSEFRQHQGNLQQANFYFLNSILWSSQSCQPCFHVSVQDQPLLTNHLHRCLGSRTPCELQHKHIHFSKTKNKNNSNNSKQNRPWISSLARLPGAFWLPKSRVPGKVMAVATLVSSCLKPLPTDVIFWWWTTLACRPIAFWGLGNFKDN